MTIHRVFVQGRILEGMKPYTRPMSLAEVTYCANAVDLDSFVLGVGAVLACLKSMEEKGLIKTSEQRPGVVVYELQSPVEPKPVVYSEIKLTAVKQLSQYRGYNLVEFKCGDCSIFFGEELIDTCGDKQVAKAMIDEYQRGV